MRGNDANQFPRRNDLCFFPELWEMMLAAGDKIIRAGGIGALEEDIIGGVDRDLKRLGGRDKVRSGS